eukprot:TRINITY_DN13370_c0_g1_i3.p1 TRINITY_DN13370_c0_g1~~TRINITY_DN13370_c0_g1_i3.p1  ORF type:complete len:427 (-),score=80.36 TRINITY_DN13370_c0_g1_i3:204-1484(-)
MDADICRICLEALPEGLISPCAGCRGSSAFVHYACLETYYVVHGQWWELSCPTCKHRYEGQTAVDLGTIGWTLTKQKYGPNALELAAMLMNLGVAHQEHMQDSDQNKEMQESAMAIIEHQLGSDNTMMAHALANLASAYAGLGDLHKKQELLERALVTLETKLGRTHESVACALVNLGTACGMLGDRRKMKDMLERALGIFEMKPNMHRREIISTLINLGGACGDLGEHCRMEQLLERSLAMARLEYGQNHQMVSASLASLASANCALKRLPEARAQRAEALRILAGSCHYPSAIRAEISLVTAGVSRALGDVEEATHSWKEANAELYRALARTNARKKLEIFAKEFKVFWYGAGRHDVIAWLSGLLVEDANKRRRLWGKQPWPVVGALLSEPRLIEEEGAEPAQEKAGRPVTSKRRRLREKQHRP